MPIDQDSTGVNKNGQEVKILPNDRSLVLNRGRRGASQVNLNQTQRQQRDAQPE